MSKTSINLRALRENYTMAELTKEQVATDPIKQFHLWMHDAIDAKLPEPNAMILSTMSADGFPEGRVVLLKEVDNRDFVFYTNYESSKGRQIANDPKVSLTFLWTELQRQVRVLGLASKVSEELSNDYFRSRPRASQIGAWVSPQSQVVSDRTELDDLLAKFLKKFDATDEVPRPPHWGGYSVKPIAIEFWQGRASRLHDRIRYTYVDGKWSIERLAP